MTFYRLRTYTYDHCLCLLKNFILVTKRTGFLSAPWCFILYIKIDNEILLTQYIF